MNNLFSNTNSRKDFLRDELEKHGQNTDVYIAVAFFTDYRFIKYLVDNKCEVQLIVRLGFPTSATVLQKILNSGWNNVYIRYYTARQFHPKLYIFGHEIAFIGSSNLTDAGLISNQELNIAIEAEDPIFEELEQIFTSYWEEAQPLTQEILNEYKQIISSMNDLYSKAEQKIYDKIGKVIYSDSTNRDKNKKTKTQLLDEKHSKRYQLFLGKFENLREIYQSVGRRKIAENILPLRIEIDQFLNWIRDEKAYKNLFKNALIRKGDKLQNFVLQNINEFLDDDSQDMEEVLHDYTLIKANCASESSIDNWTEGKIRETIMIINAFAESTRYGGGKEDRFEEFLKDNGVAKIKNSVKYLLYGNDKYTQRIAKCILEPDLKLKYFGKSCVQEIYGWVNDEDIPICNERTFKSMQWLGFGKM